MKKPSARSRLTQYMCCGAVICCLVACADESPASGRPDPGGQWTGEYAVAAAAGGIEVWHASTLQAYLARMGRNDGELPTKLTSVKWDPPSWREAGELHLTLRLYRDADKGARFTLHESLPGRTSITFSGRWVPFFADPDYFALIPDPGAPNEAQSRIGIYDPYDGDLKLCVPHEVSGTQWVWLRLSPIR